MRNKTGSKRLSPERARALTKGLKIAGLGIALWGVSLFWLEINHYLTEPVLIKVVMGLGLVILVYEGSQYFGRPHNHHGAGQDHPSNSTPNKLSPSLPR